MEISSTQGKIIMGKVGSTLREARQYVADTFFPASGYCLTLYCFLLLSITPGLN